MNESFKIVDAEVNAEIANIKQRIALLKEEVNRN